MHEKKKNFLGMPNYIASGSHTIDNEKLRFLVLPRFDQDLEKILNKHENKFNLKTVINICVQILDTLEYIHSKGFVHCDIKASNILHSLQKQPARKYSIDEEPIFQTRETHLRECNRPQVFRPTYGCRNLRRTKCVNYDESFGEKFFEQELQKMAVYTHKEDENKFDQRGKIYLMDYGLAMKYRRPNGQHRQYCHDERKAHAGTLLFCSLDAHLGAQSRRSDLECLGYNMIYWLTAKLPWEEHIENPEAVETEKKIHFQDLDKFLKFCFGADYPEFVYEYFRYLRKLTFEQKPDYGYLKKLLTNALEEYGYKNDGCLDFNNLEGWGKKQKPLKKKSEFVNKNSPYIPRQPLSSNTSIKKPMLRGRKTKKVKKLNWSKILSSHPEKILKKIEKKEIKIRDRKITDPSEAPLQSVNIWKLNPTYAMTNVYNKSRDCNGNYNWFSAKNGKGDRYVLFFSY